MYLCRYSLRTADVSPRSLPMRDVSPGDFGKVLCSSAKEVQQNSNATSREDYIPQILSGLLEIHHVDT